MSEEHEAHDNAEAVGFGSPPRASRFVAGRSGNPRGRPKNRYRGIPHDAVLGQMVTVREGGKERRITAAEAFLMQLTRKGLAGDSAAARASLEAIETARARRPDENHGIKVIAISFVGDGISTILKPLGIARRKYPEDEKRVRWELSPWIVEAALARLGSRQLTAAEQQEVWDNTTTPHKISWPDWWTEKG